jgi:hypothetical protein
VTSYHISGDGKEGKKKIGGGRKRWIKGRGGEVVVLLGPW